MRRQARISSGGALVVRSASALQVWLWLLIFIFQNEFRISRSGKSIQPGYLDFDNLPETNFTCAGKVIGGYYADLETSCQMFHVCTVGLQEEPMDIKFLCLNGTVFDQETRVCERVDEVDCTKSEKFYSLNLELYGSTAPPIIQVDQTKPQAEPTEQSHQQTKPNHEETDPTIDETSTAAHDKFSVSLPEVDSTEDPVQEIKKDDPKKQYNHNNNQPTHQPNHFHSEHDELTEEYEEIDEYEDYSHPATTTTTSTPFSTTTRATTTTRLTTTSTTTTTTRSYPTLPSRVPSPLPHLISSPTPILSSLSPPSPSIPPPAPSIPQPHSSLGPTILSPQDFIYQHRQPGTEAVSFQSFRPADGVYITHAPPQQYDHFQYESSRTAPRPAVQRPSPFVQRPQPAPFRATTIDPRDQLLRPGPSSQPSERYETSVKHRPNTYPTPLPQRPLPFNPYYYDRKRSDDLSSENASARSVAPPTVTERPPPKLKSPPRVIVTASASVSDSNGKRLNYTVGNVVSAVKPIVAINYDDYKESDLIFDPFFLDVPKLQKRRKTRSYKSSRVFSVPATATVAPELSNKTSATTLPMTSRATTTTRASAKTTVTTTTAAWNPDDYVDDNYEPHAYVPPIPPLAVLVTHDSNFKNQNRQSLNTLHTQHKGHKWNVVHAEQAAPTSASAQQTSSSQRLDTGAVPVSPPPPPPLEATGCATAHSKDCLTRA